MRIENIIDDIKNDMLELSSKLEEQLRKENPALNFSISLPGLDELTTIKLMVLIIEENEMRHYLSVHIHTHNGNRVFENPAKEIIENEPAVHPDRHPFQDKFVDLLRDIIKKKKNKTKPGNKADDFLNDIHRYVNTNK